jgi:hypothetical protein
MYNSGTRMETLHTPDQETNSISAAFGYYPIAQRRALTGLGWREVKR